jgi:hypothetical protein
VKALVAYTVVRCGRAQVWVAPWLAFVVGVFLLDASSGRAADALALNTVVVLFVAAWLTIVTLGSEAPEQAAVLAAAAGGARRERLGALLAATVGSVAVIPISFAVAWFESRDPVHPSAIAHGMTVPLAATALLGHVVACVCGVVVAGALTRPLLASRAASLLLLLVAAVLLVVVPRAPVAVAVARTAHPGSLGPVVLAGVACVVVAAGGALAWWTAGLVARRR